MKKEKLTSIMIAALLILSTLAFIYTPTVESGEFSATGFEGTIEPQVVTGTYPYPTQEFTFNITFLADTNETKITLPAECTFVSAYAENHTLRWTIEAPTLGTTGIVRFYNTTHSTGTETCWDIFHITVNVETSGYKTITWTIETLLGTTSHGTDTVNVEVTPWFDATISPVVIKSGKTEWFDIMVTNNASDPHSIYKVKITYPAASGWAFGDVEAPPNWVIDEHSTTGYYVIFRATGGYEIKPGESATFKFYMTTGTTPGDWTVECTNTGEVTATMELTVTIDDTAPIITIDHPTLSEMTDGYSVGAGNHIWINTTISDDWDELPTLYINASFSYTSKKIGTGQWEVYFYNTTAIPDGIFRFYINATDVAGNTGTSGVKAVEINNLAPKIIDIKVYDSTGEELPEPTPGKFYLSIGEDTIYINVTVWEPHLDETNSKVYVNDTEAFAVTSSTNGTLQPAPGGYNVGTANYAIINITLFDTASPIKHSFNKTVEVIRDLEPPYEIGFTAVKPICGGLVVYDLYAEDLVGVLDYVFKLNGSVVLATIQQTTLDASSWQSDMSKGAFDGVVVLNLTDYAGEFVNITVCARDFGLNEGDEIVVYTGIIPEGQWFAIELQPGWNLISLPLVPTNSSIEDVLSLLLKDSLLERVWSYDAETDAWHSYAPGAPPDLTMMTDGKGYFVKVTGYNVLIVQGTEQPPPPALPRAYHVVPGWNLIGYKRLTSSNVSDYLKGIDYIRVYKFDPINKIYELVEPGEDMEPGYGYWVAVKTEGWIYP